MKTKRIIKVKELHSYANKCKLDYNSDNLKNITVSIILKTVSPSLSFLPAEVFTFSVPQNVLPLFGQYARIENNKRRTK